MYWTFSLLLVAGISVHYVASESCVTAVDCRDTTCLVDYKAHCEYIPHNNGTNGDNTHGICTCISTYGDCRLNSECANYPFNPPCVVGDIVCLNNMCICSLIPIG